MREIILDSDGLRGILAEIFSNGGSFPFKALGGSMYPALRNGDVLLVEAIPATNLALGDVVVFRRIDGGLVAHRVVAKALRESQWRLSVRGDTRRDAEDVLEDHIVGRVVAVKRGDKLMQPPTSSRRIIGILRYKVLLLLQWATRIIRK